MEDPKWIKTEQMLDADNEHQYAHWLGGLLRSIHWIEFDSTKGMFGDSMDWSEYFWYTEEEFLERYAGHWWKREQVPQAETTLALPLQIGSLLFLLADQFAQRMAYQLLAVFEYRRDTRLVVT